MDYNAFPLFIIGALSIAFNCIDPTDVTHRGFDILDIELVLQADWNAMERPKNSSSLLLIAI